MQRDISYISTKLSTVSLSIAVYIINNKENFPLLEVVIVNRVSSPELAT